MLTKKELYFNYWAYSLRSIFYMLPIKFDRSKGEMEPRTGKQRGLWTFVYMNALLYTVFIAVRLVQSLIYPIYFRIEYFPFHLILCIFSIVISIITYMLFCRCPHEDALLFNRLQKSSFSFKRDASSSWLTRYTPQELLILGVPFSNSSVAFCFVFIYYYYSDAPQFLYSIVPAEWKQSGWLMPIFITYECLLTIQWLSVGTHEIFMAVFFLRQSHDSISDALKQLRSGPGQLRITPDAVHTLQKKMLEMQIEIKIFNHIRYHIVFLTKWHFINISIIGLSLSVYCFNSHPIVSLISFWLGLYGFIIFPVMYDNGFSIPTKTAELKRRLLLGVDLNRDFANSRPFYRRFISSVPNQGIRVGDFNTLERLSTTNFIDFVIGRTCSVLLAFR